MTAELPQPLQPQVAKRSKKSIVLIGCGGLLAVCLLIAVVSAIFSSGDNEPEAAGLESTTTQEVQTEAAQATQSMDTTTAVAIDPTSTESASPQTVPATTEPTPTSTPMPEPSPTPVPEMAGAGRSNPLPLGEVGQTDEWEAQVLEVVRGEEAWSRLQAVNQFNEPAPPGYEYALVNMRVKYIGDSAEAQNVDSTWLRSTGDARIKHSFAAVVDPEPELNATLFKDAEATGWATVLARQGETNLIGIFEPILSFDEGDEIFFALDKGANVQPLAERLADENEAGFDRNNPIPLGERAVGGTWEIWVIEYVRGDEALRRAKEANMFNEDPAAGMEYVAVRIGARNVNPDSGADSIDGFSFKLTGDAGRVYDNPSIVDPEPDLSFEVYAGGEVDGWVVLECAAGEQNLKVVYEPAFSFTAQPRYFALP